MSDLRPAGGQLRLLFLWALGSLTGCGGESPISEPNQGRARLEIAAGLLTIGLGEEGRFSVTAYDAAGAPVVSPQVGWSSSFPTIARVSPTGVITGVAPGRARITALWQGAYAFADVEVLGRELRVHSDPGSRVMVIGARLALLTTLYDDKGHPLSDPIRVTWSSANAAVATVENLPAGTGRVGMVTAVGPGTATITARVATLAASIQVSVLDPLPGGTDDFEIQDPHIVEYQYPGYPDWWFYAPIIRVQGKSSGVDVLRLSIPLPGKGPNPGFCGGLRVFPFQSVDLNVELYGDYQISIDGGRGFRVGPGSVFQGTLQYRRGDGTIGTAEFELPMVSGELPTTYTGGVGLWGGCLP